MQSQRAMPPVVSPMPASPVPSSVPVVLGVIFCDACNQFLIFPFIPFLVREQLSLAADDSNVPLFSGLLAAAYLFGQFICSPFYGSLSETRGRRPVLLTCVIISTCFLLVFGFSSSYVLSVTLRLLQGSFAGALTVGKLYLADVSDATNEGRIFSYIGIAIGTGCIVGPAIGGYLADPALAELLPSDSTAGGLLREYPYLPPCLAGAVVSIALFAVALFTLPETRHVLKIAPSLQASPLARPLMGEGACSGQTASSSPPSSGARSPVVGSLGHVGSSSLLEAMTAHASRSSLVVSEHSTEVSPSSSPRPPSGPPSRAVSAVSLALKHSLSPVASRAQLFDDGASPSPSASPPEVSVSKVRLAQTTPPPAGQELSSERRQAVFWLVQIACILFTMTNVGLTEVLPVWLSTPAPHSAAEQWTGGLGLSPSYIGTLQSTTGVGNIVLALFITFRIIRAIGPVRTFALSLFINASAALGPPLIMGLDDSSAGLSLGLMALTYSLVAASRNMMFATALMLSKEAAPGGPGVAIGINQSACSLGSAIGPALTGLLYTQALSWLHTCVPFFLSVGVLGAVPGVLIYLYAPPWPWRGALFP